MLGKVSFLVFVLSVLVLCVYAQDPKPTGTKPICKRGEAYTECGSSCTEPKCKGKAMICPAVCGPGCFCKEDYARNQNGVCVQKFMCPYKNYHG